MPRKHWYFYSLLFPFLLPVLAIVTGKLAHGYTLRWIAFLAIAQLALGGVQYLLFMFGIYWWGKNKTSGQLFYASWALPLWFWAFCTLGLLLVAGFTGRMKFYLMLGLFAIPCGYFYVILTHTLTWLLIKARLVVD